jgi:DNA-binding transcriptional MerR regulator
VQIAELARRAGVKVSALRFYERSGLLPPPPRSAGGYRVYDDAAVEHVRYLRREELGVRLEELHDEATQSVDPSGGVTGEVVHAAAIRKLAELDMAIAEMTRTRVAISEQLAEQCADRSAACPIVSALAGP